MNQYTHFNILRLCGGEIASRDEACKEGHKSKEHDSSTSSRTAQVVYNCFGLREEKRQINQTSH